jgi:hypothetical protein
VSVTAQPTDLATSAELSGLLETLDRLVTSADRPELAQRLSAARERLAGRELRVAVLGGPSQGASSLVRVLGQNPARLPGAVYLDAPGRLGPSQVPEPGAADVVLLVSDAGQEYDQTELDTLARVRAQGLPVAGIISKIDIFPRWSDVQQGNRHRLRTANLDSPSIPLLPVSSAMSDAGWRRADESLSVASGVPQLAEFLRDRITTRIDPALRDAILTDARAVADQLASGWNGELDTLGGAEGGADPVQRQQRAVAELERRQQLSVNWQLALGDGGTELTAQVEHDLRNRLRAVLRLAEADIAKSDPVARWEQFDIWVRGRAEECVRANYQLTRERARQLAQRVAGALAGGSAGQPGGVGLPDLRVHNPEDALQRVIPMEPPESAKGGVLARVVNSMRGSYGGILMVGVLTSLAGMVLINPWSIAAGLLLGAFTFWEDRKNGRERSKAEAKMAVSKLMDEVVFQVSDDSRTQLRRVHRTLRDHFTVINDQRLRAASDAVRTAADGGSQADPRLVELQTHLSDLRQLRIRLTTH